MRNVPSRAEPTHHPAAPQLSISLGTEESCCLTPAPSCRDTPWCHNTLSVPRVLLLSWVSPREEPLRRFQFHQGWLMLMAKRSWDQDLGNQRELSTVSPPWAGNAKGYPSPSSLRDTLTSWLRGGFSMSPALLALLFHLPVCELQQVPAADSSSILFSIPLRRHACSDSRCAAQQSALIAGNQWYNAMVQVVWKYPFI